jgi:chromate transporter
LRLVDPDFGGRNAGGRGAAGSPSEVLRAFLKLGVTSFGGPIAHLGYFREEFVIRRRWLQDEAFTDLVALCQFLPGPASSQVGFAIGLGRGGWLGGLAAWTGFTLPSAAALLLFALGAPSLGGRWGLGLLHGLKIVAVAVVAQAVWGMARALCPDRQRAGIAVAAALVVLGGFSSGRQLLAILGGALLGGLLCRGAATQTPAMGSSRASTRAGLVALAGFAVLLVVAEAVPLLSSPPWLVLSSAFYRAGALVFGGGHVVLPLLAGTVVAPGWISSDTFLAGYGMAQAVPGPLFTVAAFLGAVATPAPGLIGGTLALVGIFLPGLLVLVGVLPFWDALRSRPAAQAAMRGINAAVVGLLAAALYDPLWVTSIRSSTDFGLALVALVLLVAWKAPPLLVVILGAAAGAWLGA